MSLAVGSIADSVEDYTHRIGENHTVVQGEYIMWRTDQMNFSINEIPERTG